MTARTSTRRSLLGRCGTVVAAITGVAATVSTAGCVTGGETDPKTVSMTDDLRYDPKRVRVAVGESVTWETTGDVGHTVTAYEAEIPEGASYFASGGFESETAARNDVNGGILEGGDTYQVQFDTPGTYEYFCIPHEGSGMAGTVRVTED